MKKATAHQVFLFLLGMVIVTMYSCKKDNSSSNGNGSSKTTILVSGTWTFQKFEYQKKDGTWIADPDAVDADKFNMSFNANNTFNELDLVNNYSATGGWNFSADFSQITLTDGEDEIAGVYTVNQLTSSTFQITNPNYSLVSGIYNAERLTFAR